MRPFYDYANYDYANVKRSPDCCGCASFPYALCGPCYQYNRENKEPIVSQPTERKFPPPRIIRVLSVVQIMFQHKETKRHFLTKIDVSKLNQKIQRLQEEGMTVLGVFLTDVDKDPTANFMAGHDEQHEPTQP